MNIGVCISVKFSWGINSNLDKRFPKQKTVLQTFYNGPIYIGLITGLCRLAENGEILPVGDQRKSTFEDQGKSDQLESFIRGRQYLREAFEFLRVTHLIDFSHYCYYYYLCKLVLIKCSTSGKKTFISVIMMYTRSNPVDRNR